MGLYSLAQLSGCPLVMSPLLLGSMWMESEKPSHCSKTAVSSGNHSTHSMLAMRVRMTTAI